MPRDIGFKRVKHYWKLYLFLLPSVLLVAVFSYYPAISAMYHSFFRWNGEDINYWVGLENFKKVLGVITPWVVLFILFYLVIIYAKEKNLLSYVLRFVSGIICLAVTSVLLAYKGFVFLTPFSFAYLYTNISQTVIAVVFWGFWLLVFQFLVSEESENKWMYLMTTVCFFIASIMKILGFAAIFSFSAILLLVGLALWLVPAMNKLKTIEIARTIHAFTSISIAFWALGAYSGGDPIMWGGFYVLAILIVFNIVKMFPSIVTAVVVHRIKSDALNYWYRVLFVIPMIIPGMVYLLIWKFFFNPNEGIFNRILVYTKVMDVLVYMDGILGWGGVFKEGVMPVWLGNEHLVLPALILWGFPWVGVVGVLIYLAGLQGIDTSVYEAAELDGASAIQKFTHIEMPLIMTQVRINLVLMVIGTLQAYAHILILFDIDGGPNGKLMIPGLYMFREAFREGRAGYACAIGLIIFFLILILTELNNRYIRVEK
ncbi:MAG TPA: hypothetical protein DCZ94_06750 [Lentisphaeria bacterium]|nr:MAG: hypothetical protein A2X48_10640 [Lentisphaerae bacterium GWF2_49_21]HBC86634.1 hypothetical protein [Lentisphaeria bacterium]